MQNWALMFVHYAYRKSEPLKKDVGYLLKLIISQIYLIEIFPDAIASGWGRIGWTDDLSDQLLKVTLDFFPFDECAESYGTSRKLPNGILEAQQVCAGSRDENKDTCEGDSGMTLKMFFKLYFAVLILDNFI